MSRRESDCFVPPPLALTRLRLPTPLRVVDFLAAGDRTLRLVAVFFREAFRVAPFFAARRLAAFFVATFFFTTFFFVAFFRATFFFKGFFSAEVRRADVFFFRAAMVSFLRWVPGFVTAMNSSPPSSPRTLDDWILQGCVELRDRPRASRAISSRAAASADGVQVAWFRPR
jgi:hypothetical protein